MSETNANARSKYSPLTYNISNKDEVAKQSCVELLEEQRITNIQLKATYFDNCMNKFNNVYNKFYDTTNEIEY